MSGIKNLLSISKNTENNKTKCKEDIEKRRIEARIRELKLIRLEGEITKRKREVKIMEEEVRKLELENNI